MNLLDALRGEHAVIRVLLAAVSRQTHERPAADLHPSFALLEEALASHASIEDALLFDRLLTTHRGIASALESMSEDHKSIRLQISELSRSPHEVFRTRYQRFADQVAEHFSLEERILFPLAADLVSQEEFWKPVNTFVLGQVTTFTVMTLLTAEVQLSTLFTTRRL